MDGRSRRGGKGSGGQRSGSRGRPGTRGGPGAGVRADQALRDRPDRAAHCLIEGARTHNLKGITCRVPFGRITAITGVSGSGKSSLAFDTLYAEGQRRFVDCLSTYARQFLQRLERPAVDRIGEIQPPVALRQQNLVKNARSTVATLTELGDHLQLLFAYAATPFCPRCGTEMRSLTAEDAARRLLQLPSEERWILAAPVILPPAAEAVANSLIQQGHARVYAAGEVRDWTPPTRPAPAWS